MASLFNFFKNAGKQVGEDAGVGVVKLTAAILGDDRTAEIAVKQKQDAYDEKCRMLNEAKVSFKEEWAQYEAEEAIHSRFLNELEAIAALLDNPEGQNVDELNKDFTFLEGKLTAHQAKYDKEKTEAEEAKAWLDELQSYVTAEGQALVELRDTINDQKRANKQAELDLEREQRKLKQAEVLAGLNSATDKYSIAIDSLSAKTKKTQEATELAKIKTEGLKRTPIDDGSSVLGKYTQSATVPVSTLSARERLAALQGK